MYSPTLLARWLMRSIICVTMSSNCMAITPSCVRLCICSVTAVMCRECSRAWLVSSSSSLPSSCSVACDFSAMLMSMLVASAMRRPTVCSELRMSLRPLRISTLNSPVRAARLRTSSATTAKPRPASPARAASMAALRASRSVCLVIAAMSLSEPLMRVTWSCICSKLLAMPWLVVCSCDILRTNSAISALVSSKKRCRLTCPCSWLWSDSVICSIWSISERNTWRWSEDCDSSPVRLPEMRLTEARMTSWASVMSFSSEENWNWAWAMASSDSTWYSDMTALSSLM